jgi:hypothetical protein
MTPEQIEAILMVLREQGVAKFEGLGFAVEFRTDLEVPKQETAEEAIRSIANEERRQAKPGLFHNPMLWPGGAPPSFDGED